jgi:hypothetical protein
LTLGVGADFLGQCFFRIVLSVMRSWGEPGCARHCLVGGGKHGHTLARGMAWQRHAALSHASLCRFALCVVVPRVLVSLCTLRRGPTRPCVALHSASWLVSQRQWRLRLPGPRCSPRPLLPSCAMAWAQWTLLCCRQHPVHGAWAATRPGLGPPPPFFFLLTAFGTPVSCRPAVWVCL